MGQRRLEFASKCASENSNSLHWSYTYDSLALVVSRFFTPQQPFHYKHWALQLRNLHICQIKKPWPRPASPRLFSPEQQVWNKTENLSLSFPVGQTTRPHCTIRAKTNSKVLQGSLCLQMGLQPFRSPVCPNFFFLFATYQYFCLPFPLPNLFI